MYTSTASYRINELFEMIIEIRATNDRIEQKIAEWSSVIEDAGVLK